MIHVQLRDDGGWARNESTWVRGAAFFDGTLNLAKDLALLAQTRVFDDLLLALRKINGFFAFVHHATDSLWAAVDRVRSIPLFYGRWGEHFYISDDAEWVRKGVGNQTRDTLAETEFLLSGYVTGPDTLYGDVKQLQAGEVLIIRFENEKAMVNIRRYYMYEYQEGFEDDHYGLLTELDRVLVKCVQRTVVRAGDQTIVLPLSGGHDSRAIAVILKRLRHDKCIAFTYGRQGSTEVTLSHAVARNLGIPWLFVPYTEEAWHRWFHSQERRDYYAFAHGFASLPHIQDWPAVWELKRQNKLPPDALFVPGHTGDFLSGGHIPPKLVRFRRSARDVVESILKKHYWLWDSKEQGPDVQMQVRERILNRVAPGILDTAAAAVAAYERWEWQERQAKYIVNSVRAYEFWGYDWWLPLWDAEFIHYWERVPLRWRLNRQLFKEYVSKSYATLTGISKQIAGRAEGDNLRGRVVSYTRSSRLFPYARQLHGHVKRWREYDKHPLAWYGIMSREMFRAQYTGRQDIRSFLVKELLGQLCLEAARV